MASLSRRFRQFLFSVFVFSIFVPGTPYAQSSAERVKRANKEGAVNFYGVWQLEHLQALKRAFNRRYPSITLNILRQGGQQMITRLDTEAKTGRNEVDVVIISDLYWQILMDKGLVTPYCSPELKSFPDQFKDPKCRWTVLNINTHVIAYNTALVPKEHRPKTLEDLLHPRWKGGKLVMDTTDDRWFTQTLDKWGEEKGLAYMKKLAAQKPDFRRGHTLMLQIVAAGEYPVNIMSYGHNVEFMKLKGAPLDWSVDQPVTVTGGAVSVAKRAPHPTAARLLVDFLMSKEAQEVITTFNRIATRVDVPPNPPRLVKGLKFAPVKTELGRILPKRVKQFRKIFGLTR